MLKITKNYILISLCLMVSLFFISCAGSSSSAKKTEVTADKEADKKSGSKVECVVIEEYGDETIDAFTKGSYDLCSRVGKNIEKLREINVFLEDPKGFVAAELKKAAGPYMEKFKTVKGIAENPALGTVLMIGVFTEKLSDLMTNVTSDLEFAGSQIGGVAGATSAATGLKGFKTKIAAAKSVKAALGNYKNAAVQMKDLAAEAKKAFDNIKNLVS